MGRCYGREGEAICDPGWEAGPVKEEKLNRIRGK